MNSAIPANWLCQTDPSGRVYYVDVVTGNSSYVKPDYQPSLPTPGTATGTTGHFSTDHFSTGFSIGSKPSTVLSHQRLLSSTTESMSTASRITQNIKYQPTVIDSSSLIDWINPAFSRVGRRTACLECTDVRSAQLLHGVRFSKSMLASMSVLCQVDRKYIICLINNKTGRDVERDVIIADANNSDDVICGIRCSDEMDGGMEEGSENGGLLVVIDQHAAHERIRLEQLLKDLYYDCPSGGKDATTTTNKSQRQVRNSLLHPPLKIHLLPEDVQSVQQHRATLLETGISFSLDEKSNQCVLVHTLPQCLVFSSRKRTDELLAEFVTEITAGLVAASRGGRAVHSNIAPVADDILHQVLCSHACHGAIKFGDRLSRDECTDVVRLLSKCELPFQCAHGRPSIYPLVNLKWKAAVGERNELQDLTKPKLFRLKNRMQLIEGLKK